MNTICRLWAGKLFGTNTGNIFVELDVDEQAVTGTGRFADDRFGVVVYKLKGTFDGSVIDVECEPTQVPPNVEAGTLSAKASLTPEGELRGQWSSTIGTGGTLHLFPHDQGQQERSAAGPLLEQLYTATRPVGALRLYLGDVMDLIGLLRREFNQGLVVVTYRKAGSEISTFANAFERETPSLKELNYLKLFVQETEAPGLNRTALVELNAEGNNEVRAQSIRESVATGLAEALAAKLRTRQKGLATTFRRFGLNINGLLFFLALTFLPDLPLGDRAVFLASVVVASAAIFRLHARFVPNAQIFLSEEKPGIFERAWPQLMSWLIAASATLFATAVYGFLKGEIGWTALLQFFR